MKEVEEDSQIGKSMAEILEKLQDWHFSNINQRKAQISASNAKFLIVRETTNKSSNIKPNVGDIVVLNTTKDTQNIGQIVALERSTAKILSQDKIYRQPISYLTPLYTETDDEQDKKVEGRDTGSSNCTDTLSENEEALYEGFNVNIDKTEANIRD